MKHGMVKTRDFFGDLQISTREVRPEKLFPFGPRWSKFNWARRPGRVDLKSMCSPVTLDLCLFVHSCETEPKSDPVQRSDLLVSTLFTCATHCTCLITMLVFCLEKYINAQYLLKSHKKNHHNQQPNLHAELLVFGCA